MNTEETEIGRVKLQGRINNFESLFQQCRKLHTRPGGARICICGAGCGGSSACNALYEFQMALRSKDQKVRDELLDLLGW